MRRKVFKSGNSLAVVVPASFAKRIGIEAGDEVKVEADIKKERLTLKFPAPRQLRLAQ